MWQIAERDGVERASMRAIAAEAGTSVGMLQHHFSDKEEILAAAIRSRMASKHARLARSIARLGSSPDPAQVLVVALRHRLPLTSKLHTEARVLQHWLSSDVRSPLKAEVLLEGEQVLSTIIGRALREAQARGQLAAHLDVEVLTCALVALNDGLMHSLMLGRHGARRATAIIETQVSALLNGG
ncbi:MAG TPA: TetR/AcrR family transcriptional regulator [Acidimicrobiales bacterium]|nr:TetR/AcrR family transcriptional regulator [Acidimicrobiales bacterium]